MISVVTEMPTCAPDSWNDSVRWARWIMLVAPAAGAGVGVDGAAFQGGQRELGRHEHRRPEREDDEGQQGQQCVDDAHRVLVDRRRAAGPAD